MKLPGLYQKTDTKIYYFQPPQIGGIRPKPISLGTRDEDEAVSRYLDAKEHSQTTHAAGKASLEIERFLKAKRDRQRHTERTTENARGALLRFVSAIGNKRVANYTRDDLERYRDKLSDKSSATIRSEFGWLSSWFSWLKAEGLIATNFFRARDAIELPKTVPNRAERYCTREEREALLTACARMADDVSFLFWVGFFAGLRLREMIEARGDWFDLRAKVLTVQRTPRFVPKDKQSRTIPISDRLAEWLDAYDLPEGPAYAVRPEKEPGKWRYRWESRKDFERVAVAAGLPWVTSHTLRHTFATLHLMAGTPITLVSKWLGNDVRTTQRNYAGYIRQKGHESAID